MVRNNMVLTFWAYRFCLFQGSCTFYLVVFSLRIYGNCLFIPSFFLMLQPILSFH